MISLFAKYNERIVQIPVNPESLTITGSANNKTTNIVNLGQINDLGFPELKELKIESFFPFREAKYVNTNGSFQKPDFYIKFFNDIKKDRKPFRLIITDININMLVSIESFEYTYKYGTDDVDYKLDLKEYKTHNIRVLRPTNTTNVINKNQQSAPVNRNQQSVAQASPTTTNSNRPVEKHIPRTYTVRKGDDLWTIAQRLLGRGSRWREIYTYNNNKKIIGGNPNLIRPGQVLSIPN